MKPLIIPIFISHTGCPHRCIFCDQERITSQSARPVDAISVREVLDRAIHTETFDPDRNPEVAFYGGTFTGLPKDKMKRLLQAVAPYIEDRLIRSIRVSTRPDCIDEDRLKILRECRVETVELGVQSMDENVLSMARRGHTTCDVTRAVSMLKEAGFKVGVQLMPGLPGDSLDTFRATIEKVICLGPDMARIYPALVIAGTDLARMYDEGTYRPLTLKEALDFCVDGTSRLEANGIPVIRIGLMSSPSLLEAGRILAGPWHPAFGFLVRSAIHHQAIEPDLPARGTVDRIRIFAPQEEIPLVRGHRNQGIRMIEEKTGAMVIGIASDDRVPEGRVRIEAR
ncbi:MAG: radical SAM protein [Deltaproteobacteria bacterium]|nr:radical SAM protein [Deltaproteobacteria bacterium]